MSSDRIVYVVDDDPDVRRVLELALGVGGFATVTYGSGQEFLQVAPRSTAGCILLDVVMPGMGGLEVLHELDMLGIGLPVILMTGHGDTATAVRAMKGGAADFIEKPVNNKRLIETIERLLSDRRSRPQQPEILDAAARIAALSPREREVLKGLAEGGTNKTIAYDLRISVRTLEVHRARMLDRLGLHSIAEAIRLAVLAGL
jgi:two-component system response regulator FixJ